MATGMLMLTQSCFGEAASQRGSDGEHAFDSTVTVRVAGATQRVLHHFRFARWRAGVFEFGKQFRSVGKFGLRPAGEVSLWRLAEGFQTDPD